MAPKNALLETAKRVESLAKQVTEAPKDANALPANTPEPEKVFGAPTARKGESVMNSRGFSFLQMIKAQHSGNWDNAKNEKAISDEFKTAFPAGLGKCSFENGTLMPFGQELIPEEMGRDKEFGNRIKSMLLAGVEDADPGEMYELGRKAGMSRLGLGYGTKSTAQSWLDTTYGGALVGPPEWGQPIDLWRNQDALARAGATIAPMPPTGRFQAPRQTNASAAYFVGEGAAGTATNVKTGLVTWTAKKLMGLLVYNNELLKFGGATAEMLFRMDLTRSMTLGADQALLEGPSMSDVSPLGLINTQSISTVTPTTPVSGNTGAILAEQDIYSFPSVLSENNVPDIAGCSFLMRPAMYYALLKRRTNAANTSGNDNLGLFAFSPFRNIGDKVGELNINGFRVTLSTQVSQTRAAGSGKTNTYIIFGYWPDYLILMAPMMEFVVATQGNPAGLGDLFSQDQFCLKSIMFLDGAARHPGGFAWCDSLQIA